MLSSAPQIVLYLKALTRGKVQGMALASANRPQICWFQCQWAVIVQITSPLTWTDTPHLHTSWLHCGNEASRILYFLSGGETGQWPPKESAAWSERRAFDGVSDNKENLICWLYPNVKRSSSVHYARFPKFIIQRCAYQEADISEDEHEPWYFYEGFGTTRDKRSVDYPGSETSCLKLSQLCGVDSIHAVKHKVSRWSRCRTCC